MAGRRAVIRGDTFEHVFFRSEEGFMFEEGYNEERGGGLCLRRIIMRNEEGYMFKDERRSF